MPLVEYFFIVVTYNKPQPGWILICSVTTQGHDPVPAVAHALAAGHALVAILTPGHALDPDQGAVLVLTARAHVGVPIHGLDPNLTASLDQGPNEVSVK